MVVDVETSALPEMLLRAQIFKEELIESKTGSGNQKAVFKSVSGILMN
jgi:hypothetical protein